MARGRKQKYGEPTVMFRRRVPQSKKSTIETLVKDELKKYEVKNTNRESEATESKNSGENLIKTQSNGYKN